METCLFSASSAFAGRGGRNRVPFGFLVTVLLFAQSIVLVAPEIIELDMIIDASSAEVHFVRGYLQAPASVSLSNIKLITDEQIYFDLDDAADLDFFDDAFLQGTSNPFAADTDDFLPRTTPPLSGDKKEPVEGENKQDEEKPASESSSGENKNKDDHEDDEKSGGEEEKHSSEGSSGEDKNKDDHKDDDNSGDNNDGNSEGNKDMTAPENSEGEDNSKDNTAPENSEGEDNNKADKNAGGDSGGDNDNTAPESSSNENKNKDDNNNDENSGGEEEKHSSEGSSNENKNKDGNNNDGNSGGEEEKHSSEGSSNENKNKDGNNNDGNSGGEEEQHSSEGSSNEDKNKDGNNNDGDSGGEEEKHSSEGSSNEDKNKDDNNNDGDSGGEEEKHSSEGSSNEDKNKDDNNNDGNSGGEEATKEETNKNDEANKEKEESTKESESGNKDTEGTESPKDEGTTPPDRLLEESKGGKTSTEKQVMDVILFMLPSNCRKDMWGYCDWVALGVGAYDNGMEGGMSYCCSKDTAERGVCASDDIGTMMINHRIFEGEHRTIDVPTQALQNFAMDDPDFDVTVSGDYVLLIANCDDDGLGVITLGSMDWKSVGGYLPGDIYGLMYFFAALAGTYFVLVLWYYCGMRMFQDAAIPIQKYILTTIILGFFETSFQGLNLYLWNVTGTQSPYIVYTALGFKILEHAFSRCLGVMVAMGWGVVRDSLGASLCKIIFLGLLYSGVVFTRDFLGIIAETVTSVSLTEEEELVDLALVLSVVAVIIEVIFVMWIVSSLTATTDYLKNMNQTTKLRRHMRLRCLVMTAIVVLIALVMVTLFQFFSPFLSKDQFWILRAVGHGNYLFVLFGVAVLWRPNANAKEYVMQMELPAIGDGDSDLELSCVVPSADAMDFDDEYKVADGNFT